MLLTTLILDCANSHCWMRQHKQPRKLFAITFHEQCFGVFYSVSGIRELAASPCLLPPEMEKAPSVLQNKQLYSLEYLREGAERWLRKDHESVSSTKSSTVIHALHTVEHLQKMAMCSSQIYLSAFSKPYTSDSKHSTSNTQFSSDWLEIDLPLSLPSAVKLVMCAD